MDPGLDVPFERVVWNRGMSDAAVETEYFNEREMREALCEIGRRVWIREFVASNDGNFSVRLSPGRILCTPTGVSKGFMKPEELAVITPDGKQLSGPLPLTSEIRMHLAVYRHRPDLRAVVHVHPPHATAFAIARTPLPKCVLPEVEVLLGEIPIAPYATPGTDAFADTVVPFLPYHNAILLASHGAVCVGMDPFECYYRMETLNQYCRILLLSRQLGDWNRLTPEQTAELLALRQRMGYRERRLEEGLPTCCPGIPGSAETGAGDLEQLVHEITLRVLNRLGR